MHISYWKLNENPFQNVTDTRFAYLGDQYREALARLLYLVEQRKTGGVLAGPYGVGKSMVLELLGDRIREDDLGQFIQSDGSGGGTLALARLVLRRLGYANLVYDTSQALDIMTEHFAKPHAEPDHLILAVDEAHLMMNTQAAEFLHLLTNVRRRDAEGRATSPAVTLILSGHPELAEKLVGDGALRQRLQMSWTLTALTAGQTMEYVHYRIRVAGGDIWTFEESVFPELFEATAGLPRLINNVCDVALVLGAAEEAERITPEIMREAIAESSAMDVVKMTGGSPAATAQNA